jgi:hypothetical protein
MTLLKKAATDDRPNTAAQARQAIAEFSQVGGLLVGCVLKPDSDSPHHLIHTTA